MAKPLVAVLAAVLALHAWAAPAPAPLSPESFKAALVQRFIKDTDIEALDFTGQPEPLAELGRQAKYVQDGREEGDNPETHVAFVRSVARRLGAPIDPAIALYGARPRGKRETQAKKWELAARAGLAEDVKRNPGISEAKKARVAHDLDQTNRLLMMGLNGDASFIGGPSERPVELVAEVVRAPVYDSNGVRDFSGLPPRAQPVRLVTSPTPSPPAGSGASSFLPSALTRAMYSLGELTGFIDTKRGAEVSNQAIAGVLEQGRLSLHRCYNFVKQALIDAGVIDAPNPQSTAVIGLRPNAAQMFNSDVARHPEILDRLKYRRASLSDLRDPDKLPLGSILIYGQRCGFAYYDKKLGHFVDHGHSELTVARREYEQVRVAKPQFNIRPLNAGEVPACHYNCVGRTTAYLRTLGTGENACLRAYVSVTSL